MTGERGLAVSLAVFVVLMAGLAVVSVAGYVQIGDVASQASRTAKQIQASRAAVCEEANARHDHTIRVLDAQIAELPARQRLRAERQRDGTVALIEALAPKRDCRTLR